MRSNGERKRELGLKEDEDMDTRHCMRVWWEENWIWVLRSGQVVLLMECLSRYQFGNKAG
jgi:hypothetical protein